MADCAEEKIYACTISFNVGRPRALHTLAALAPYLFELAKVKHRGSMDRRPLLHPVPISHGRFPVKAAVIRHILQEQALHLARALSPFLDIKRLTLFLKELVELWVTVLPQVRNGITDQARIIEVWVINRHRLQNR